jgi:hypothetical protein
LHFSGVLSGPPKSLLFGVINALMGELTTIVTDLGTLYSDAASAVGL